MSATTQENVYLDPGRSSFGRAWQAALAGTGRSAAALAGILLLSLLIANFLIVKQNRSLRHQVLKNGPQYLSAGEVVPTLRGLGLDDRITSVAYGRGEKPTLLLVLSPSCGWCKINLPNWQAILDQASNRYRVVAISISRPKTAEYVRDHGLSKAAVIVEPEPRDLLAYKLQLTPQTILVNADGTVRKNWMGAFSAEDRQEIESTLGVRLPASYFDTTAKQISAKLTSR
ncbi:MAG: TlpA family protein disulfide reductase [Thermoanaerobaculia bacterium]